MVCQLWIGKYGLLSWFLQFGFKNLVSLVRFKVWFCRFVSSVRSSNSHPDLLLIHPPPPPHFFRSHRSSTLDFYFLSHYSYIEYYNGMNLYSQKAMDIIRLSTSESHARMS